MISVITTTFNCAPYIYPAIQSILNQSYKNFEYLIIDDGSEDNTQEIISKIEDDRVAYYQLQHVGRSAALNYGLQKAKYDIIALMDADDISHPQRFEKQINQLKGKNEFVFCDTAFFKDHRIVYLIEGPQDYNELQKRMILHGHFNNSSSMFYKSHVVNSGGYDENLTAYEDYELWLRLNYKSRFKIIPGIYHYVRLRNSSMSTSNPNRFKNLLYQIQEKYFVDLAGHTGVKETHKQNLLKGWREFFYGEKKNVRIYWKKVSKKHKDLKVWFVAFLTIFPESFLNHIKKQRVRLRLLYIFGNPKKSISIQNNFKNILSELYTETNTT